ncbi:MAG TPA: DUF1850 domain-containing protein, partial [Paracoccaceae bacterium]|nr:DUF1850 domain-containing protein [Paracoccaceae bacterium]
MTCLMVGAVAMTLAAPAFSLHWTHSVEKVEWVEHWAVLPATLRLTRAAVKGSGAGMEPAPDAVLQGGWWVWHPGTEVPELRLAASGATGAGWRLCDGATCHDLGVVASDALVVAPCAP